MVPDHATLSSKADLNGDGTVDIEDFSALVGCMEGPGVIVEAACSEADLDGDDQVSLSDFVALQANLRHSEVQRSDGN